MCAKEFAGPALKPFLISANPTGGGRRLAAPPPTSLPRPGFRKEPGLFVFSTASDRAGVLDNLGVVILKNLNGELRPKSFPQKIANVAHGLGTCLPSRLTGFESQLSLQFGCVMSHALGAAKGMVSVMCWICGFTAALVQRENRPSDWPSRHGTAELEIASVTFKTIKAAIAQPVEHLICNQGARSSTLRGGTNFSLRSTSGEVTSLSRWADGFEPRTQYQDGFFMRVKACKNDLQRGACW